MFTSAVFAAMIVAAPASKEKKPDPGKIEGDWVVENYVLGGKENERTKGKVCHIGDGTLVMKGERVPLTYKIDPKTDPQRIDLTAGKEVIPGIYKVDGDILTICFPKGGKGERPAKFESPADSEIVIMTLKRVKKD